MTDQTPDLLARLQRSITAAKEARATADQTPETGLTEAELRETLSDHFVMWHDMGGPGEPPGEWRCACGFKCGFSVTAIDHQAQEVERIVGRAADPFLGCSQCGERMADMVKVGTSDGWCSWCLNEAAMGSLDDPESNMAELLAENDAEVAARAVAEVVERVEAVLNSTEWDGWPGARRLTGRIRAALPPIAAACTHRYPDGTVCGRSPEWHDGVAGLRGAHSGGFPSTATQEDGR